jgi:hypothetical protein
MEKINTANPQYKNFKRDPLKNLSVDVILILKLTLNKTLGVNWYSCITDRFQWPAVVDKAMNLLVS